MRSMLPYANCLYLVLGGLLINVAGQNVRLADVEQAGLAAQQLCGQRMPQQLGQWEFQHGVARVKSYGIASLDHRNGK